MDLSHILARAGRSTRSNCEKHLSDEYGPGGANKSKIVWRVVIGGLCALPTDL